MTAAPGVLDVVRAARNFSRAAAGYERAAALQATTRVELLDCLAQRALTPARIVDLGCGSGPARPLLRARWPGAALIGVDRAAGMIVQARSRGFDDTVVGDAETLPLADASVDLVYSNLALQWCPQPLRALREAARVLRPGGTLAFAVPGPATLRELRLAWRQIDTAEHVHRFAALEQWQVAAAQAGLVAVAAQAVVHQPQHADVRELMQGLRDIGARNASPARRRHWLGKSALARLEAAYAPWRRDGGIYASWEILYLIFDVAR